MEVLEEICPKAKLLAGSYMCSCHGLHRAQKPVKQPKPKVSKARVTPLHPQATSLSPQQIEEIRQIYVKGTSKDAIARQFHCGRNKIREAVVGLQKPPYHRASKPSTLTPEEIEQVRALYEEGVSFRILREKFHCGGVKIHNALEGIVKTPKSNLTPEQQEEVRVAHAAGETISDLARRYDRDRWTIYGALGRPRDKASIRNPCESSFVFNEVTYWCHLKEHAKGTHRTTWRDGDDTKFRVEWQ